MSAEYNTLPSEILRISDDFAAWCVNQALAYIKLRLDNGGKLRGTQNNGALLKQAKKAGIYQYEHI